MEKDLRDILIEQLSDRIEILEKKVKDLEDRQKGTDSCLAQHYQYLMPMIPIGPGPKGYFTGGYDIPEPSLEVLEEVRKALFKSIPSGTGLCSGIVNTED